jgi:hypothetical protein
VTAKIVEILFLRKPLWLFLHSLFGQCFPDYILSEKKIELTDKEK